MNRDRVIAFLTGALIVLELALPTIWALDLQENSWIDFQQKSIFIFVAMVVGLCSFAYLKERAGWIVFLRATWSSFLILWVLFPLFGIWFPDLTEGASMFPEYMLLYGAMAFVTTSIYMLVVPVLFSSELEGLWKWIPVFDLYPGKGKTVEELKKGVDLPPRRFVFGEADRELVSHWRMVGRRMLVSSAKRKRVLIVVFLSLALWPVFVYFAGGGSKGAFDRDIVRLWEVQSDVSDEKLVVPTKAALNAARRLFNDELAFRGLTRLEARQLLKIERKDDRYRLDKPEFSWQSEQLILRMSDGKEVVDLLAGYDDDGRIKITWKR